MLFISFLQLAMPLFSDFESKQEDDFKLKSAIKILDKVSFVNALNAKNNDILSLVIYIIF